MKKWLVFILGILTGIVLTCTFSLFYAYNSPDINEIRGLELFESPKGTLDYSKFEVFQVLNSGCALATANGSYGTIVLLIPDEGQCFFDDEEIILKGNQSAQYAGIYKYSTVRDREKTVPAIRIINQPKSTNSDNVTLDEKASGKVMFDKPGDCVSTHNFEVQSVLDSGDAIAKEINEITSSGYVFTSDLEVLFLAQDGVNYYNNQIIKTPKGKCARQIGAYKYKRHGNSMVIPIVEIR